MPFDIHHPAAICKILLFACTSPEQPFLYEQVSPQWYDAIEPDAAAAVIQKLNVQSTKQKISGNVLNIGSEGFLEGSSEIREFDARPLWNVKIIHRNFLSASQHLQRVDFSGITFECCTEISDQFLAECYHLVSIDISSFVNVEKIGCNFLANCRMLEQINLGAFGTGKIRIIMAGFCSGCSAITFVDVSPISKNTRHLPNLFFARCSKLRDIKGLEHFEGRLESIGANFLAGTAIEELDVSFLSQVERIDMNFLSGCNNLTSIKGFDKMANVTTIARGFLHFVPIVRLVLNNQKKCEFLDCGEIVVSRRDGVTPTRQSRGFLYGCNFLEEIDLSSLIRLEKINLIGFGSQQQKVENFLLHLPSLARIIIPKNKIELFSDVVKPDENKGNAAFRQDEMNERKAKLTPPTANSNDEEENIDVVHLDVTKYRKRRGVTNKIDFLRDPDWPWGITNKNFDHQYRRVKMDEAPKKENDNAWYSSCVLQ